MRRRQGSPLPKLKSFRTYGQTADSIAAMHDGCAQGLVQMEALRRAEPFVDEGYPDVKKYALRFYKKDCMIRKAQ